MVEHTRVLVLGTVVAAAVLGNAANGQQATIESLPLAAAYGNGVHGFFSGTMTGPTPTSPW